MKTMQKTLSVLLAVLLAAASAVCAFAASENVLLSGKAGQNVSWKLTDNGVLTVSGSGPIEDEAEYEYDENGEISCTSKLGCISWTLQEYWETQTGSMDIAAAERARFNLVREIVIEEGITSIPDEEFDCFFPQKVTLPASLKELGFFAFDASFAEQVVFKGDALQYAQFKICGYNTSVQPFADRSAAIEGYIAQCQREDQFQKDTMPLLALQEIFYIENGLTEVTDDERAYILEYYNELLGTDAATLEELTAVSIDLLNRHYGTNYASINDFYQIEEDEWGTNVVYTDALQELYQAEADSALEDKRLLTDAFGNYSSEDEKHYTWLTVVAPAGSQIETLAGESGIPFRDLYEGLCKYCHQDHSGNLWQKFVGFIHKILYFFAHLFGKK